MTSNGIDWEKRTGKPLEQITIDDKVTVVVSILDKIESGIKPLPDVCKAVEKHGLYFKGIWALITLLGIPVILLIIKWLMG